VLAEPGGRGLGTVCLHQAAAPRRSCGPIRYPPRAGLPRDERSIMKRMITAVALLAAATALAGGRVSSAHGGTGAHSASAVHMRVFASGFNNPRALTFWPRPRPAVC